MKITVVGAGSWGTAMAVHSAKSSNTVTLCPRLEDQAIQLNQDRVNTKYLP